MSSQRVTGLRMHPVDYNLTNKYAWIIFYSSYSVFFLPYGAIDFGRQHIRHFLN